MDLGSHNPPYSKDGVDVVMFDFQQNLPPPTSFQQNRKPNNGIIKIRWTLNHTNSSNAIELSDCWSGRPQFSEEVAVGYGSDCLQELLLW